MMAKQDIHPVLEMNFPLEYRFELCGEIFENIKKRESFSLVGMKDNNKKNILRFITFRCDVQKKYLGDGAPRFRFVYVDSNELPELNIKCVLQLLARRLAEQLKVTIKFVADPIVLFDRIRKALVEYSQKENTVIVLMFNNFEVVSEIESGRVHPLLIALREAMRYNLVYVLTATRPLGGNDFFANRIVWSGLFNREDALGVINRNAKLYQQPFTKEEVEKIYDLSGAHPGLIKYIVQNYAALEGPSMVEWFTVADITTQCRRILSVLHETEIADLKSGTRNELLINLQLQQKVDGRYVVFSPLLDEYLRLHYHDVEAITIENDNGVVTVNGKIINEILTPLEEALLTLLVAHEGETVTREMMIEHVWDRELPTDWAIDQLISRLRKKLKSASPKNQLIHTVRGKGLILKP